MNVPYHRVLLYSSRHVRKYTVVVVIIISDCTQIVYATFEINFQISLHKDFPGGRNDTYYPGTGVCENILSYSSFAMHSSFSLFC